MTETASSWSLLQPIWLIGLPLPLVWLFWRRRNPAVWPNLQTVPRLRFPGLHIFAAALDSSATESRPTPWPDVFTAAALIIMIIALSQPIREGAEMPSADQTEPVEVVLVVGTAVSMSLRDYRMDGQWIDRMSVTRALLEEFIDDYSGSGLALVVIGSPPAVWLPMTPDKQAVNKAVQRLRPVLGGRLSQMGDTLELVATQFANDAGQARDRVVVLISDAGLQTGATAPEDGARAIRNAGLSLYTIAMGSPDQNVDKPTSGLLHSPVDLALMEQLAIIGGGKAYQAIDTQAFSEALSDIERQHRRPVSATPGKRLQQPLYPTLLVIALILLGIGFVLGQRAGNRLTGEATS